MANVKIAVVTMETTQDKQANLEKMESFVEKAAAEGVDLIQFPEMALNGFPNFFSMAATDAQTSMYWTGVSEAVPEGPTTQRMIELAKQHDMYICLGMTEHSTECGNAYYNTAVLVGPEGFVGKHRKVHMAGTEGLLLRTGKTWDVFDTAIGRVGILTCIEKTFGEPSRCMKMQGADIILNPTGWPITDAAAGEEDFMVVLDKMFTSVRALENNVVVVEANLGTNNLTAGLGEAGHSRIVGPMGNEIVVTGLDDEMAIAEIDVASLQRQYLATFAAACSVDEMRDLRPDIYIPVYQDFMERN